MTADRVDFSVKRRDILGKKVGQLRNQGMVIGNLIVPNKPSIPLVADSLSFNRLYDQVGESVLVYLTVEGEKSTRPVLVEDVDFDPRQGTKTHFVFKEVNLKEKVEAEIPVEVVGEFKVPGAVLLTVRDHVEVRALPTDLPEQFIIDATQLLAVGESISLADLDIDPEKVELVLSEDADPADMPVVLVQEERVEVEPEPEEVSEVTPEGEAEQSVDEASAGDDSSANGNGAA